MKTKEKLNELKNEVGALNSKPDELADDELEEVTGGVTRNNFTDLGNYTIDPDRHGDSDFMPPAN